MAHVGLFNRKANEERLAPPIGIRLEFDEASTTFSREEPQAGFNDRMAIPGQIRGLLTSGAKSVKEIAAEMELPGNAIRTSLSRMPDAWRIGQAEDGSGLWGLRIQHED